MKKYLLASLLTVFSTFAQYPQQPRFAGASTFGHEYRLVVFDQFQNSASAINSFSSWLGANSSNYATMNAPTTCVFNMYSIGSASAAIVGYTPGNMSTYTAAYMNNPNRPTSATAGACNWNPAKSRIEYGTCTTSITTSFPPYDFSAWPSTCNSQWYPTLAPGRNAVRMVIYMTDIPSSTGLVIATSISNYAVHGEF
jgi:hypothetical protein